MFYSILLYICGCSLLIIYIFYRYLHLVRVIPLSVAPREMLLIALMADQSSRVCFVRFAMSYFFLL